jgi:glycosyltransferase involved in cell wall biosynthesis/SAM-dependent methyltransferase
MAAPTRDRDQLLSELRAPAPVGAAAGLNRYLYGLYLHRPDLREAFPDLEGPDAQRLAEWAHEYGQHQVPIRADLLPEVGEDLRRTHARARTKAHGPPPPKGAPDWWGVNMVGYLRSELGLGEGARQIIGALDAGGVPLLPIQGRAEPDCRQDHPFATLMPSAATFPVNLLYLNPDGLWDLYRETGPSFFQEHHSIGFWWWEVEGAVSPQWLNFPSELLDEVWVGTRHVAACLEPFVDVPIRQVRIPVSVPEVRHRTRGELGLPEGFLFLFSFDYNSAFERKNPLAVIEAFGAAFAPGDGAKLVIKCINSEVDPVNHSRLRSAAEHPDVHLLDGYLSSQDKNALLASCDCYVSLHRAEGLGHPLAEAMYLGKPVIATRYSGNLDFMSARNGYLVDHGMTAVGPGVHVYPAEARWAEPDVGHASRLMRHVFDDPAAAAERGRIAASDIRTTHSPSAAGATLERALAPVRETIAARRERDADLAGPRATLAQAAALVEAGAGESPPGRVRRLARAVALRAMRPHIVHQRRVDTALHDALAESVSAVDELSRRATAAETAGARAQADVLAALRANAGGSPPTPWRTADLRGAVTLGPRPAPAAAPAGPAAASANGASRNGRPDELRQAVDAVPYWRHSIDLGHGVVTPGEKGGDASFMAHELRALRLPEDLEGRTVLDIGAWDGFYSFEAERRGAARVVALDHYAWEIDRQDGDARHPATLPGKAGFDLAHRALHSRVEPLVADFMEVDVESLGRFDLVLFLGVIYHVEDPVGAMRRVAALTGDLAVIETAAIVLEGEEDRPVWQFCRADEFDGDPTTWWVPNLRAVHDLCQAAGFSRTETVAGPPPGPGPYRAIVHAWA